jgi:integrase
MATIRKHRSKWEVQIRRAGARHISKSFHRLEDAKTWGRLMEVKADQADLPADPKTLHHFTLGELVQRYRDNISIRKRSFESERLILNAFLRHPLCTRPLSNLRREDFAAYRAQRLNDIKPASVNRQLAILQHLFEVARSEWGIPLRENPVAKLRLHGADQRRERRLRDGELDKLLVLARNHRNPYIKPLILFALATAMRRGEILAVTRADLDLDARALLIPVSKNGQSRTIPLTTKAIEALRQLPHFDLKVSNQDDRMFPITANAFRLAWERIKRRAKIDDLHFHDLRHEAISRFFELGLSIPEVALISGHRDVRMLFRYTHPLRAQILQKLDG